MDSAAADRTGLRFHWGLPTRGLIPVSQARPAVPDGTPDLAVPDFPAQVAFCEMAERCGIDSVLMAIGYYMPDPLVLAAALGTATKKIKFIVAHRPGLMAPPLFVQQVNTASVLANGRISLNVVMGHSVQEQRSYGDYHAREDRYRRADDYLAVCHALWRRTGRVDIENKHYKISQGWIDIPFAASDRTAPEIYFGGASPMAREVAGRHADVWMRLGSLTPQAVAPDVEAMRAHGKEVGMRFHVMIAPTREEAVRAMYAVVVAEGDPARFHEVFLKSTDSTLMKALFAGGDADADQWPTPWLWTGAVPSMGPSAIFLVGSPKEVAAAIGEYRRVGVTQFILNGWPQREMLQTFAEQVLPLVRADEQAVEAAPRAGGVR